MSSRQVSNTDEKSLPPEARGNPVYEQTREDMPLWCCGRNCGRNSRICVLILGIMGIICSVWLCLSVNYFSFRSLRNDTFWDEDKRQPEPFEWATEADVGLFRYRINEVYVFEWPPKKEFPYSRLLEDRLLEDRLLEDFNGTLFPEEFNETLAPFEANETTSVPREDNNETLSPTRAPTLSPTTAEPTTAEPTITQSPSRPPFVPPIGPGSTNQTLFPTEPPSFSPTISNPNDQIDVDIGEIKKYEEGFHQFDQLFRNAQLGAVIAPIFAAIGLAFSLIELCCCLYKCSWLPPALFLYMAFMFQGFTLFLFLSEDFCKYAQDCRLKGAGYATIIAVICYMIANTLVCCTPRPPPCFDCFKKPPKKRRKKPRAIHEDPEEDEFIDDFGNPHGFDEDEEEQFGRRPSRQYDEDDPDGYGSKKDGYDDKDDSHRKDRSHSNDDESATNEDGYDHDGYDQRRGDDETQEADTVYDDYNNSKRGQFS